MSMSEIFNVQTSLHELRGDISRRETWGAQNGFIDVEEIKNKFVAETSSILNEISQVQTVLPPAILKDCLSKILSEKRYLKNIIRKIEAFPPDTPTHEPAFIANRQEIHMEAKQFAERFPKMFPGIQMRILAAEGAQAARSNNSDETNVLFRELEEARSLWQQTQSQATEVINDLREAAAKASLQRSQSCYASLATNHKKRHLFWFFGLIISLIATSVAVYMVVFSDYHPLSLPDAILVLSRNVLLISAVLLVAKVCLTKYNTERHLRVTYDHRTAAIDQLRLMADAIGSNPEAQTQLRLEAAKMILSDPASGYMSGNDGPEVNINPVIGMLEKITSKD